MSIIRFRMLKVDMWIIFTQALLAFGGSNACNLHLETFQTGIWKVPEDTQNTLNISLSFNTSSETRHKLEISDDLGALLIVTVVPDEDWKLNFVNSSAVFTAQEVNDEVVKNITFSGYYWGITRLSFYLTRNDLDSDFKNRTFLRDDLQVVIDRRSRVVDIIFISVLSLFVLFNNINMGAQLDIKLIWRVLKKPVGPICGLLSQFICMPTVTWIMGSLLFTDTIQRLGLFTYGCCPGGTSSNFWTLMFNGDLNLSITMTAVSFVAAMGMMPLWMFTLGSRLTGRNETIVVPFSNLAISLFALSFPVCIGILLRLKRPTWADRGKKILKPCSLFVIIFFLTVGIFNSYKVFVMMTWHMIIAGLLVVVTGYSFGALFAKVMCLEKAQVIAVSIETAMQNTGVATILLKLSLDSPFSDLASIPVFATFFVTGPPLILVYFFCKMFKRLRNRKTGKSKKNLQQEQSNTPENIPFLSGRDCKTNDEESKDVCSVKDDGRVAICSIEDERTEGNCNTKDQNMQDNCGVKEDDLEDNCGIEDGDMEDTCGVIGDDIENNFGIKNNDMKDECGIKGDDMDNNYSIGDDIEINCIIKGDDVNDSCGIGDDVKDTCRIEGDDIENNYGLKGDNVEGKCGINGIEIEGNNGIKDGDIEDNFGIIGDDKEENNSVLKSIDKENNCGRKGNDIEDNFGIKGDKKNNCGIIGGEMEEDCVMKGDDLEDNCIIKGDDKADTCGIKDDDMMNKCRINGDEMKEISSKRDRNTEDNGNKIDVGDNHYKRQEYSSVNLTRPFRLTSQ